VTYGCACGDPLSATRQARPLLYTKAISRLALTASKCGDSSGLAAHASPDVLFAFLRRYNVPRTPHFPLVCRCSTLLHLCSLLTASIPPVLRPLILSRHAFVQCTSPAMSHSLPLLKRTTTLNEALDEDADILQELSYPVKWIDFYCYLIQHGKDVEDIVSFHLGVPRKPAKWKRSSGSGFTGASMPAYLSVSVTHLDSVREKCSLDFHYRIRLASHNILVALRRSFVVRSPLIYGFKVISLTFRYPA
jgi:hypothetical protein